MPARTTKTTHRRRRCCLYAHCGSRDATLFNNDPLSPSSAIRPFAATLVASLFSGAAAKFDVVLATTMHRKFHELLLRIPGSPVLPTVPRDSRPSLNPFAPVKRVPAVAREGARRKT